MLERSIGGHRLMAPIVALAVALSAVGVGSVARADERATSTRALERLVPGTE